LAISSFEDVSQGGSNVILVARRADALKTVSSACFAAHKESGLQHGGKFATVELDVSDKIQVATLWEKVPQELRCVDVLGKSEGDHLCCDY
jgi:3-hydroxy acid dehydrogenase/malonic semialdehyde reductase